MRRMRGEQPVVERESSIERSSLRSDEGTSDHSVVTHEDTCAKDVQQKKRKKKGRHFDREIRAAQLEVELVPLLATNQGCISIVDKQCQFAQISWNP